MQVDEARRVLGLGSDVELELSVVRATYRRLIRNAHPDVNARPDAADRSARLTVAYRVLTEAIHAGSASGPVGSASARPTGAGPGSQHRPPPGAAPHDRTRTGPGTGAGSERTGRDRRVGESAVSDERRARGTADPPPPRIDIALAADDTIAIAASAEEAFMVVLDAAHDLGEIGYLDRTAGLIEVIVEFVEAPTSSVLFSFQGRSNATTEVFCTVEPLSGGDAPPADAVTRLVLHTLREAQR